MHQVILFSGWYSAALCRSCPDLLFVFGDNTLGFGKGGQAIIRSEPNTFGIPTKRKPSMASGSFFMEGNERDLDAVLVRLGELWDRLEEGRTVVIPINQEGEISLGLERARLRQTAPGIYDTLKNHVNEMCVAHGWDKIEDEKGLEAFHATLRGPES
jgi:hypothetical protein